ncbi:MAG: formylglycine-generating enzyme family protein [Proteobacteria bacterium]|nr:formylglycine-generating enzyme family protein [Pseudomonadota bacterium]MBU1596308.1 formylglycine-generating enzyme family protein [Pseudomonadota bacterium]
MRSMRVSLCVVALLALCSPVLAATPGKEWKDPATGMEFVWVPKGCFQMGDTFGGRDSDEKPVHEVCLDGFWLGRYSVTQRQWAQVMGANPSRGQEGGDAPVDNVTWQEAKAFVARLNAQGKEGGRYRLPTEAEWEYACRSGGQAEMFAGGADLDRLGWFRDNSGGGAHPVGQKAPNGLGLYDMSGNVFQWTEDVYEKTAYAHHARSNPLHTAGWGRVARGGYWGGGADCARCSFRCYLSDRCKNASTGLRVALAP